MEEGGLKWSSKEGQRASIIIVELILQEHYLRPKIKKTFYKAGVVNFRVLVLSGNVIRRFS